MKLTYRRCGSSSQLERLLRNIAGDHPQSSLPNFPIDIIREPNVQLPN